MSGDNTDRIPDTQAEKTSLLNRLFLAMIKFDEGDPLRIQHFTKVHSYARLIAQSEEMDPDAEFTLEAAAYVHDIGIHVAEEKYGHQNGKLQEQEGPAAAWKMMTELHFPEKVIERVEYLVGHHHTYTNIDSLDYQILVEADFIVNLFEDHVDEQAVRSARDKIFKTKTGTKVLSEMFGLS